MPNRPLQGTSSDSDWMALIFQLASHPNCGRNSPAEIQNSDFQNSDQTSNETPNVLNLKQPAISLTFGVKRLGARRRARLEH